MSKTVLVTGASGYIGGQTVLRLSELGYTVVGIDLVVPSEVINSACSQFYVKDIEDIPTMNIMRTHNIDTIIHCAGSVLVGESVSDPRKYYQNNFVKTKILIDYLISVRLVDKVRFIFSSSAAIYGEPFLNPCDELAPPWPINPYGESKLMVEMAAKSYQQAYGLDFIGFRYFNAAGADSQGRHGQAPKASHIIARVLESIRDQQQFTLHGADYATKDGTCIRDYVHVEDIAAAHIRALDRTAVPSGIYNLSNGTGYSNYTVINEAIAVTGQKINLVVGDRRLGDPEELIADGKLFTQVSGWAPKYNLNSMIQHAWTWYNK